MCTKKIHQHKLRRQRRYESRLYLIVLRKNICRHCIEHIRRRRNISSLCVSQYGLTSHGLINMLCHGLCGGDRIQVQPCDMATSLCVLSALARVIFMTRNSFFFHDKWCVNMQQNCAGTNFNHIMHEREIMGTSCTHAIGFRKNRKCSLLLRSF